MKKIILFILPFIIMYQSQLSGQIERLRHDQCSNKNITLKNIDVNNTLYPYMNTHNMDGLIEFHPFTLEEVGGWNSFINSITDDNNISFENIAIKESKLFNGYYFRFRQLFKGIPVDGGGFSLLIKEIDDPELFRGSNNPSNPCGGQIAIMSPYIYENINLNTAPAIHAQAIQNNLTGNILNIQKNELKIVNNIKGECDYKLAWELDYKESQNGHLVGFMDANTGEMLYKAPRDRYKDALTNYGPKFLIDEELDENTTILRNDRVAVHNLNEVTFFEDVIFGTQPIMSVAQIDPDRFSDDQIPTSPISNPDGSFRLWELNDASLEIFTAFWVTNQCLDLLESELGEELGGFLRVGVHPTAGNARAFLPSGEPGDDKLIALGQIQGEQVVVPDVIGHELGHFIVEEMLKGNQIEVRSITEGVCEMIGTFLESKISGLDWIAGDDVNINILDLQNTPNTCFTDISNFNEEHDRAEALQHWFFLCVNGDPANNIEPMSIDELMKLVLDALPNLGSNPDYPDLMNVTVDLAKATFGICSDQFQSIVRAWDIICVPTGEAIVDPEVLCLDVELSIGNSICEENYDGDLFFSACRSGNSGLSLNGGSWQIIGENSSDFESVIGLNGNNQQGGHCLEISAIPDMPYYPQVITIRYRHPDLDYSISKRIQINDCDHDDPTCEEYYGKRRSDNYSEDKKINLEQDLKSENDIKLIIYDILGNRVNSNQIKNHNNTIGILIYTYWDKTGQLVDSKKVLIY